MNPRGQHAIELILLIVAVLLVMIAFLRPSGPMHQTIDKVVLDATVNQVTHVSQEIKF